MSEEKLPFALMPIEAFFDRRLTLTQLRVLGALLSFRNRSTGAVFPGRAAIAVRTGLPLTKISTATTELVALGWLRKRGCGGRSSACTYEVITPVELTRALLSAIEVNGTPRAEPMPETADVPESGTVPDTGTPPALSPTDVLPAIPAAAGASTTLSESGTVMPQTVTESGIPEAPAVTDSVTPTVPESGTKQLPKRERAKKRPGTDQGTEQSAAASAPSDYGTRLALSELPPDWAAWIAAERPDLNPRQTWEKFHDYWSAQAGAKGRKRDWFAAWRFWARNEYVNNSHRRNGNGTPSSTHERRQRIHDQIRENALRHLEEMD